MSISSKSKSKSKSKSNTIKNKSMIKQNNKKYVNNLISIKTNCVKTCKEYLESNSII